MTRRAATITLIALAIPLIACILAVAVLWLAAPASTMNTGLLALPVLSAHLF